MAYSHRNIAEEQKEASRIVKQITDICDNLSITLDPIDWQGSGMRAWVTVNTIKIADLLDLGRLDITSILRRVQIKLLEHAALEAVHAHPGLKVLIWSPVDVVQPQAFSSLWILTMETNKRIAIAEYIRHRQRVYEQYTLDVNDEQQLIQLFGPAHPGKYHPSDTVTIEEHQQKYTGEIVYIFAPGKEQPTGRKYSPGRSLSIQGKTSTNEVAARYIVDCHDGFPHVVNQWQVVIETNDDKPS